MMEFSLHFPWFRWTSNPSSANIFPYALQKSMRQASFFFDQWTMWKSSQLLGKECCVENWCEKATWIGELYLVIWLQNCWKQWNSIPFCITCVHCTFIVRLVHQIRWLWKYLIKLLITHQVWFSYYNTYTPNNDSGYIHMWHRVIKLTLSHL